MCVCVVGGAVWGVLVEENNLKNMKTYNFTIATWERYVGILHGQPAPNQTENPGLANIKPSLVA